MILQIHHQTIDFQNGPKYEFVSQNVINTNGEMREWMDQVKEDYPLPEGCEWFICTEDSPVFIKTHEEK